MCFLFDLQISSSCVVLYIKIDIKWLQCTLAPIFEENVSHTTLSPLNMDFLKSFVLAESEQSALAEAISALTDEEKRSLLPDVKALKLIRNHVIQKIQQIRHKKMVIDCGQCDPKTQVAEMVERVLDPVRQTVKTKEEQELTQKMQGENDI